MSAQVALQRFAPERTGFARDVVEGLTHTPKRVPPKYFYDAEGSRLFDQITEQPEYYPTRSELAILQSEAPSIAAMFPPGAALIEFGMGSSQKARLLLDAAKTLAAYVPVDIAPESLHRESLAVATDYPKLAVLPVVADFTQKFELPREIDGKPRVGFFPGSTIGNFEPHEATRFLQRAATVLGEGALLIVGVDRIKDSRILNAAYNDARGITAAFNLNLLTRINREIGGNFRPECFEHHAFFNRQLHRIEMHLASLKRQKVRVDGESVEFRAGETIHTENSYKYSPGSFGALARGAGWKPAAIWSDPEQYFSVHALTAEPLARR
jgi:dimethylhistidine N-methyltransferase